VLWLLFGFWEGYRGSLVDGGPKKTSAWPDRALLAWLSSGVPATVARDGLSYAILRSEGNAKRANGARVGPPSTPSRRAQAVCKTLRE
jgi:hypothetical protein